jgi:hypothetical protein
MTKEEAETKIKAAGWSVAAERDWREAVKLLRQVAEEIEAAQWKDSR